MANAAEIAVSIEQVIHKTLRETLQRISKQHGIQVERIEVDWINVSTTAGPAFQISGITASTSSR